MPARSSKPLRMAPLQELTVEPITDPAEIAALNEKLKRRNEAAFSVRTRGATGAPNKTTLVDVLDLARQLTPEQRLPLAMQWMAQLSSDERLELIERLVAQLPADVQRRFGGQ